ncbi:MAG TPA: transporter substrate-binding domain-containing protein [Allosphingosinicella sp.]|nr:transporter substrate-binding domain-containing protein [Allosphingosinicella sp.]
MTPLADRTAALRELAPHGTIRIALNVANAATVAVSDAGTLGGPAPALAEALAAWTGLPIAFTRFGSAREVVQAAEAGDTWDVAFLAIDPSRAGSFHFTPPYLSIEATAAVWAASAFHSIEALDGPGVRIATSRGAAYDSVLQRMLQHAQRIPFETPRLSVEGFEQQRLEAVAGVRQMLEQAASGRDDIRLLPGRIAVLEHAMVTPIGRQRAGALLDGFVRDAVITGLPDAQLRDTVA